MPKVEPITEIVIASGEAQSELRFAGIAARSGDIAQARKHANQAAKLVTKVKTMLASQPLPKKAPKAQPRGLLSEDHTPIKIVKTRMGEGGKPKMTKRQREAIVAEVRERRERGR